MRRCMHELERVPGEFGNCELHVAERLPRRFAGWGNARNGQVRPAAVGEDMPPCDAF